MRLLKICPVCGWDKLKEPPYNEFNEPSYEICACCGFEYGYTDTNSGYSFNEWRLAWIDKTFKFRWTKDIPDNWGKDLALKQLANIKLVSYKPRLHNK